MEIVERSFREQAQGREEWEINCVHHLSPFLEDAFQNATFYFWIHFSSYLDATAAIYLCFIGDYYSCVFLFTAIENISCTYLLAEVSASCPCLLAMQPCFKNTPGFTLIAKIKQKREAFVIFLCNNRNRYFLLVSRQNKNKIWQGEKGCKWSKRLPVGRCLIWWWWWWRGACNQNHQSCYPSLTLNKTLPDEDIFVILE